MTGGRHGIDDDWRLLALKFVHGADASTGKPLLKLEDLSVVWGDDRDFVERNWGFTTTPVGPGRAGFQDVRNEVADRIGFFRRRTLISVVPDREMTKARTVESGLHPDCLPLKSRPRLQPTFIELFRIEGTDERMKPPCLGQEQTRSAGMVA
jgi:hypothetical protein